MDFGDSGPPRLSADAPKRKFNIDKVCGSATNLKPIDPDDRWFAERSQQWPDEATKID